MQTQAEHIGTQAMEAPPAQPCRVLIVDDDQTARLILKELLLAEGMEVVEADNGETALERFHACDPDLILMDVDMPGMDGLSACTQIRTHRDKASLPIIIVSGREDARTINTAYDIGVSDFVIKPVNPPLLANRIRTLLAASEDSAEDTGGTGTTRILETLPDQLFVLDRQGKIIESTGSGKEGEDTETEGANISALWPASVCDNLLRLIRKVLKSRQPSTWKFRLTEDDVERHYEARVVAQGINRAMVIVRDNTADAAVEAQVDRLGLYDPLTGLPNRFFFLKRLDDCLVDARFRQRRIALVLYDIQELERKREALGRSTVDALLVAVARRLEEATQAGESSTSEDGDVALLSERQFGVILRDIPDPGAARRVAEGLAKQLREPIEVKDENIHLEVCVGVAAFPEDGGDIETLLQEAEHRVLRYGLPDGDDDAVSSGVRRRLASLREDLLEEVRWAFEQEQFALYYMPKFDIRRGQVTGVEALLRWLHPLRGEVPLSEFFPMIKDTDLIVPVSDWVLRTACSQIAGWRRDLNPNLVMSVNCAAPQFSQDDFVERIASALEDTGLGGDALEIELTEHMLMGDHATAREKLCGVRDLGIGIVLDDFGTGFTSLKNFADMPLRALKIDSTFVRQLPADKGAEAICGAIVDIAHRFGAVAAAEGVESDLQLEVLARLGCDEMQGYLYTRPLPAEKAAEYLELRVSGTGADADGDDLRSGDG